MQLDHVGACCSCFKCGVLQNESHRTALGPVVSCALQDSSFAAVVGYRNFFDVITSDWRRDRLDPPSTVPRAQAASSERCHSLCGCVLAALMLQM